jgi:hypothetical protein
MELCVSKLKAKLMVRCRRRSVVNTRFRGERADVNRPSDWAFHV